jgi:hydroxyacylglutathione hydrolase
VNPRLQVVPVPCLRDNYAYLVFDEGGDGSCLVVDACESAPVEREVRKRGLHLGAILTTHHHWDHVGGNTELSRVFDLEIVGHESESERIPGMTRGVAHGEQFEVLGLQVSTLHVPGHTLGAVVYAMGQIAFTGDTLFCGGCGRLFEGTAAQMHHSLVRIMGEISDETTFYCGHEYTHSNLEFARSIWDHSELESRCRDVSEKRAKGIFCASAPLGLERATNPFLLCHRPELQRALNTTDEISTFTELRRRKDRA